MANGPDSDDAGLTGNLDGIEALSFDCYGTLIDWETGIGRVLVPWARRSGLDLDADTLVDRFGATETGVQLDHPTWPYPEVLAEVLRRIGSGLGVPVSAVDAEAFGRSVGAWPAFDDSAEALQRLAGRFRLVVLSNVDPVSFRLSNDRLGVEFDHLVLAGDVGAYKPASVMFDRLETTLTDHGLDPGALLHVAESLYHDHLPALARGWRTAWVHRRHAVGGFGATAPVDVPVRPTVTVPSMAALARLLC
ncbi:MAG: haloacid dehalogenase [Acidimicrobiales bacterium]